MSQGFAKVSLLGNLGNKPEVKMLGGGNAVSNIRVASSYRSKSAGGEYEDKTEWTDVVLFGKTAENAAAHLEKGRQVYVEGRKQTREWTDKEGNKRTSVEVIADNLIFLGGGKKTDASPEAVAAMTAVANTATDATFNVPF
jgi:single-strand DNA-binding protein